MGEPKATNTYVFIIRDAVEKQMGNLIIPDKGRVKPHRGKLVSIGGKITDPLIKKGIGSTALFHQGIGFEIEVEGVVYLVLQESEVIAVL